VTPRKTLSRIAVASVAAGAIAAPGAVAMPIDPSPGGSGSDSGSVYTPSDVRTPDSADRSRAPHRSVPPNAVPPTWPLDPKPLDPPAQLTVADDGDGLDWQVPAIAAGGIALVLGGLGVRRLRIRSARMHPAA
jgi:hypothetical protein